MNCLHSRKHFVCAVSFYRLNRKMATSSKMSGAWTQLFYLKSIKYLPFQIAESQKQLAVCYQITTYLKQNSMVAAVMAVLWRLAPSDVVALASPPVNNGFPQRANKSARNRTQPLLIILAPPSQQGGKRFQYRGTCRKIAHRPHLFDLLSRRRNCSESWKLSGILTVFRKGHWHDGIGGFCFYGYRCGLEP